MCCDKVGVGYRWALFGKRPSPYYGKNSSNKQRETTVHHYFNQSIRNISSAVAKTIKRFDETGSQEDHHRKGRLLQRISSLEITAHQIAAQINASQSSTNRHISTSTVQRTESGLHGQIDAKKPLLKDTKKKKRFAWAKKHKQWTWLVKHGGAGVMVILSVIHLEFKAHWTSMDTTAFCSDTPSHLVCA